MTWLLVEDVATVMQVHPRTVQRWCRERRIPHVRVGRGIRFTEEHVKQIVEMYAAEHAEDVDVSARNPSYVDQPVEVAVDKALAGGRARISG